MKVMYDDKALGSIFFWNHKYFRVTAFPEKDKVQGIEMTTKTDVEECIVNIQLVEWI